MDITKEIEEANKQDFEYQQRIAYLNWRGAGCPENRDLEFWLQAERQLFGYTLGELDASIGVSVVSKR